jgi:hypothetical protein
MTAFSVFANANHLQMYFNTTGCGCQEYFCKKLLVVTCAAKSGHDRKWPPESAI